MSMAVGSVPGTPWIERTRFTILVVGIVMIAVGFGGSFFVVVYWAGSSLR